MTTLSETEWDDNKLKKNINTVNSKSLHKIVTKLAKDPVMYMSDSK